jgi:peptidoglycan/xylan/chitin deacetylase (PgdA/CDA1 family)
MTMRAPTSLLPGMPMCNALTIDVEDYYHVSALAPYIARSEWDARESRVETNVERILAMLDEYGARATFFTLGWVAERYPGLVRSIVKNGHELASHGFAHQRASTQTPEAFFSDIQLAKVLLEDIAGVEVSGYRAPSFSIGPENEWAFECIERGRLPVQLQRLPDSSRSLWRARCAALHSRRERRVARSAGDDDAVVRPQLAGGRRRVFSAHAVFDVAMAAAPRQPLEGQPAIFYFHPWEIDAAQPRVPGIDAKTRFRHYVNLGRMEGRLRQLLFDFEWGRVDEVILDSA